MVIQCIFFAGQQPYYESDEYVQIANLGLAPQDIAGWVLENAEEGYPSFTFPDYVLPPGEVIRVYTNEYHPETGGFTFGSGRAVWDDRDPELARLLDVGGTVVSEKTYPPGC